MTPSQDVRRRAVPLGSGRSSRLIADIKPWLIVALFLLVLGLAGGIETGAVWP